MNKVNFSKKNNYLSNLIVIDGFSGSGKILIAELLKAIKDTEVARVEGTFDYLPIIYSLGQINQSAADAYLKTLFDRLTYYMIIGREINLRKKDLTFALDHPYKLNYLKNLFSITPLDSSIEKDIAPIKNLPYMVHMATFNNTLLEEIFNKRIKIIYTLRDPLYILETYSSYMDRIGNDPREFTPKISYKNYDLPWYSIGWEDEFLEINNTEKSIVLINKCLDMLLEKFNSDINKENYHFVFFEDITINTDYNFMKIKNFLNLDYSPREFAKRKKKNKIPRLTTNIEEGFWKRYTTNNETRSGYDEKMLLDRNKELASPYYFGELLELRKKYFSIKKIFQNPNS